MNLKTTFVVIMAFVLLAFTRIEKQINTSATHCFIEIQTSGKQLFMTNCASCHHPLRNLTGPTIYGVRNTWKSKKLLYEYVRNAAEVINKDAYAKQLHEKWNKVIMPPLPKLTNADIDAIFDYVDGEAKKKGLIN
jgi:mono/diheme cytochrome c family protein